MKPLSKGTTFNDVDWPLAGISRSRFFSTLNILEKSRHKAILTMEFKQTFCFSSVYRQSFTTYYRQKNRFSAATFLTVDQSGWNVTRIRCCTEWVQPQVGEPQTRKKIGPGKFISSTLSDVKQETQLMLTNPRVAFRGQSRSPRMHIPCLLVCHCLYNNAPFWDIRLRKSRDLETGVRGHWRSLKMTFFDTLPMT